MFNKLPHNSFELTLTIPAVKIAEAKEKITNELVSEAEIDGFRKGKAPREVVEPKLDQNRVKGLIIEKLLPEFYAQAIQENNLQPIVNPQISLVSVEDGKDWQFKAVSCEKPTVTLGNYKEEIHGLKAKAKLWVPGKDIKPDDKESLKSPSLGEFLQVLIKTGKVDLADMLIEEEANKLLSQLLTDVQKLGLSLEQYLANVGKNVETIKAEYAQKARETLSLEFILAEIAEVEKITVTPEEIASAVSKVEDAKAKEQLQKDSYYLSYLLRKQKTLEFLQNL